FFFQAEDGIRGKLVTGVQTCALPISTTSADNAATFVVVVSNTAGSVTSNAATLTVNSAATAPSITTQPASQTVTVGQTATFTVEIGRASCRERVEVAVVEATIYGCCS